LAFLGASAMSVISAFCGFDGLTSPNAVPVMTLVLTHDRKREAAERRASARDLDMGDARLRDRCQHAGRQQAGDAQLPAACSCWLRRMRARRTTCEVNHVSTLSLLLSAPTYRHCRMGFEAPRA